MHGEGATPMLAVIITTGTRWVSYSTPGSMNLDALVTNQYMTRSQQNVAEFFQASS